MYDKIMYERIKEEYLIRIIEIREGFLEKVIFDKSFRE